MCIVSIVGDYYKDKWWPNGIPNLPILPPQPYTDIEDWRKTATTDIKIKLQDTVTQDEFEKLKKEVEEMKVLLQKAKDIDKATGQPDCEMESKVALLEAVAKAIGVDLGDIFMKEQR